MEPRLARLAHEDLVYTGDLDAAQRLAQDVLAHRTTDDGYAEFDVFVQWNRQGQAVAKQRATPRIIKQQRLPRPAGRENPNPNAV
jgi:hypothetical protein